jgi:signal transduction histidine kinase
VRPRAWLLLSQAPLAAALIVFALRAALSGGPTWELGVAAAALALGVGAAWRLGERLRRPLDVIAQAAQRIASGDAGARVRLPSPGALDGLARDLNTVAARLGERDDAVAPTRRALAADQDLAALLAHELKTPLTSLRLALHMLAENVAGPLTEKQAELVAAGREDCERLQALVDEALAAVLLASTGTPVEAGTLERRPLAPRALVDSVLAAHRAAAEARGVALQAEVWPGTPALRADPERVQIALANLVANAVRHTPAGGRVTLACRPHAEGVRFEVRDTGPGIPPEFQARVFERFFRVPGGGSTGSGLGLWIVRAIARAHGGAVGVESEPGQGSRFWITLPGGGDDAAP